VRLALYGSRPDGHARVVLEVLLDGLEHELLGLIDDVPENVQRTVAGLAVIGGGADLGRLRAGGLEGVVLGFGAARGRDSVVAAIAAAALELPTLIHPSAHIASSAHLGPGVQVLPQASVGPGASIGRGALVNTGSIVEHDVVVGEAAVVGPGAVLAGRVRLGGAAEMGAGAVAIPDVEIGARALVGAGAVVTRDVDAGATVAGVPARLLQRTASKR
jgi:sugar O-acyltransferase (sialic acid O-acetyltransferase NeuD family)